MKILANTFSKIKDKVILKMENTGKYIVETERAYIQNSKFQIRNNNIYLQYENQYEANTDFFDIFFFTP